MEITYRPLRVEDTEKFYKLVNIVKDEGKYLFYTLRFTIEETKKYIVQHVENEFPIWGAFDEKERLLGWIDYNVGGFKEIEHVALLGMGVMKESRGNGIGSKLIEKCLVSAKKNDIEKIELEVFSTNHIAYEFYKKNGFIEEGRKIRKRKFEGHYEDLICMYQFI